jgi:hypothetical protein
MLIPEGYLQVTEKLGYREYKHKAHEDIYRYI